MGLTEYKKKRSFQNTPEPTGGKNSGDELEFVVQKHDASRLHYDFRLELDGVLKSWAVPKGPSLNPADKRLAMMVEDHPFDYKDFEGIIPEGNYGAGTVIIWDQGTYEPVGDFETKKEKEEALGKAVEKGSIKIRMSGEKLNGEFALVRIKGREKNAWLLIKHRDEYASDTDVTKKAKSVVSGKTIEQLAMDKKANKWKSNRSSATKKRSTPTRGTKTKRVVSAKTEKKSSSKKESDTNAEVIDIIGQYAKNTTTVPKDLSPMLATLVDKPSDQAGWIYEVKWDGYRAISYLNEGKVDIRSRNNKDFNKKFYPLYKELSTLKLNAVVDGEIIVMNRKGFPDFEALQNWRSEADGDLMYFVFDILWLEGVSLMEAPLSERKKILKAVFPVTENIRVSETFDVGASEFYAIADKMGLEGIVAKKADSKYTPGKRSKEWLKIKTEKHQEAVIGGYTKNENSNKPFSALLLGVFDGGEFVPIGPVGTGFTVKQQQEILAKLKPLETRKCPFNVEPDYNKASRFRPNPVPATVTWVKPEVVIEIVYREKTTDGSLRHPSYRGIREDKQAKQVVFENPEERPAPETKESKVLRSKGISEVRKSERKTLLNPKDETQVRTIDGHDLKFTNLSKVFWPEHGVTKRDMLNYYYQVAPYMLPYYKDRPQTLNRFPNGIHGKSFYQKDVTGKVPAWLKTHGYYSEADERQKQFLVCTDEASLLYIASLGCIEMNPWSSRTQTPDNPDWCIIDLDPDDNPFSQVIETAQVTKAVLDAIGVPAFCKTSGSTGLHIYIPFQGKNTYEDSKEFGRVIAKLVHAELPKFTSIERYTAKRKGKIYIDFLQNRPQATVAGPYSLRPKVGAPVSMPLEWDEVVAGLKIADFNIFNSVARLKERGDIFKGVLQKGVDWHKALRNVQKIFKLGEVPV